MSTPPPLDLELYLRAAAAGQRADLVLSDPAAGAPAELAAGIAVGLDLTALRALSLDPQAYGASLTAMLFADPALRLAWATAVGYAQRAAAPLRLRIRLEAADLGLHELAWELLRSPLSGLALATDERVLLSRYIGSPDAAPLRQRAEAPLRVLACLAAPSDLGAYGLAAVDVAGELARLGAALGPLAPTLLGGGQPGGPASLPGLLAALRDGYDVLYLVAHGAVRAGQARLWLEGADGRGEVLPASVLADALSQLAARPILAVLASCQSAGGADALGALGPQLIQAGIPAVLAMQGPISMATVALMMPALFRELQRDGQIDRAVAAARGAALRQPDWWRPSLLMRVRDGRLWRAAPEVAPPPADQRQGVFVGGGALSGPVVGVNHGAITIGAQPPAPPDELAAALALLRGLIARARQLGDGDLAEDLAGAAQTLAAAQRAGDEGRPERRASKLAEALAALDRLAPGRPEIQAAIQVLRRAA